MEITVEKRPEILRQEAVNYINIGDLEKAEKNFKLLRSMDMSDELKSIIPVFTNPNGEAPPTASMVAKFVHGALHFVM